MKLKRSWSTHLVIFVNPPIYLNSYSRPLFFTDFFYVHPQEICRFCAKIKKRNNNLNFVDDLISLFIQKDLYFVFFLSSDYTMGLEANNCYRGGWTEKERKRFLKGFSSFCSCSISRFLSGTFVIFYRFLARRPIESWVLLVIWGIIWIFGDVFFEDGSKNSVRRKLSITKVPSPFSFTWIVI